MKIYAKKASLRESGMEIIMKKKFIYIIGALAATAFIFSNSLKTATVSDASSNVIVEYVKMILMKIGLGIDSARLVYPVRKTAHVTEFLLQGMFISGCFGGKYKGRIIYILFFGLLTACVDELIQSFVPGRGSLVSDVFIDFAGTSAAAVIAGMLHMRRKKRYVRSKR